MATKIFTAGLLTETNTFAPYPTDMAGFTELMYLRRGEGVNPILDNDICAPFIERAQECGWAVAAGLRTFAQPAGVVLQAVYEQLRDELLLDLQDALPVDAVLLSLHGAMVSESQQDCEGDILERVRRLVGDDVPIGVHCDPHCHLTEKMVANADVIRIWKEYPHSDMRARSLEVFDLIEARLEGAPRAIPVIENCGMTQLMHTTREPMRTFVDRCTAMEGHDGIQGVNLVHSFPWGDVSAMGAKILIYAETAASLPAAKELAEQLSRELWSIKEKIGTPHQRLDESLDNAYAGRNKPVVIADGPDNPGGGAPGDSTWFLRRLLERELTDWAVGYLFDPQAVATAMLAGEGARVSLSVGGKVCELSGSPVEVSGVVSGIAIGASQKFGSVSIPVGDAVAINLDRNRHVVLISKRNQTYTYNLFEQLNIYLADKRAIVIKSSQHFYDSFRELSDEIIYAAPPGVLTTDFRTLHYRHIDQTMWPFSQGEKE